jgi:tetratricopeptide (TPR) repeat protein
LSVGKRSIEDARNAYDHGIAALSVWTKQDFPEQFSVTQNAIGNLLLWISSVDLTEFVLGAMRSYEAASTAISREAYPNLWARIQSNLGAAYVKGSALMGDRDWTDATKCLTGSSDILSKQLFPYDYALNQSRMGDALLLRRDTSRETNLAAAMERYTDALDYWSRKEFPEEWAAVQRKMGDAFRPSDSSESREDIERAISHYEEALSVRTRADFPVEHAEVCLLLTGPLVILAMQLVETPEKEREAMSRALHCYRAAIETISTRYWFSGVVRSGEVMGKLFCQMFAQEMVAEFEREYRQLDPLLNAKPETVSEVGISSALVHILNIVDVWIKRLKEEERGPQVPPA